MAGFVIDLFAYVGACGFLTGVWLLNSGSVAQLQKLAQDPTLAARFHFWPIWVIMGWAAVLVLHLGIALAVGLRNCTRRARRRRRQWARLAASAVGELKARSAQVHHPETSPAGTPAAARNGRDPTRHWVTVMFTDVANSTALNEGLGDDEWARVLAHHRAFMRARFEAWAGEEVGTQGDGFLARFATPADAVRCAIEINQDLDGVAAATSGPPLRVRVGIHTGDALEDADGDLIGRIVNLAARVTAAAAAGEILITESVAEHVEGLATLEDRGLQTLRGVTRPRHLFAVRWAEAGQPAGVAIDFSST